MKTDIVLYRVLFVLILLMTISINSCDKEPEPEPESDLYPYYQVCTFPEYLPDKLKSNLSLKVSCLKKGSVTFLIVNSLNCHFKLLI